MNPRKHRQIAFISCHYHRVDRLNKWGWPGYAIYVIHYKNVTDSKQLNFNFHIYDLPIIYQAPHIHGNNQICLSQLCKKKKNSQLSATNYKFMNIISLCAATHN